jgi:hypothetical protein
VTGDLVFEANFTDKNYKVGWGSSIAKGTATTATHGTSLTFTPTADGQVVTGVTYTVDGVYKEGSTTELKVQTPVNNGDGSYTIPGENIVGNITITVTSISATFEFITYDQYRALEGGTKIAVLYASFDENNRYYLDYGDGKTKTLYWNGNYENNGTKGAYLAIVDNSEDAASVAAKLTITEDSGAANYKLNNQGDVNRDGQIDISDVVAVYQVLLNENNCAGWTGLNEEYRLEMDVKESIQKTVTIQDVLRILNQVGTELTTEKPTEKTEESGNG